jgi:hypothetical protein
VIQAVVVDSTYERLSQQIATEKTNARRWLIVVGIIQAVGLLAMAAILHIPVTQQRFYIAQGVAFLIMFGALWWFAQFRLRLCLGLGLVIFWAVQIVAAIQNPHTIYQGLPLKVFFTGGVLKGLQSANHAEDLRKQLGQVFE